MELVEARALADRVLATMRSTCSRCEIAGSVRREKPIVKDIEIVAIVESYDDLFEAIRQHGRFIKPGVPDVIDWEPKVDAKYLRVILNEGIKLDLFIATPDNWAGIFLMRTGSGVGSNGSPFSGFIPGMFSRFKKLSKGGKMIGGIPTMPSGEQLLLAEEEDFFELLEMNFVPPKERTDRKVIKLYIK